MATPIEASIAIAIQGIKEEQFKILMHGAELALLASNCALTAGETAMHNNLTTAHGQAWSMFAAARGIVQRRKMITKDMVKEGDVILGLASNGLHSNGTSLATKVLGDKLWTALPELDNHPPIDFLLAPTQIYVQSILALLRSGQEEVHGLAHITGGGLPERITQLLPEGLSARVKKSSWEIHPIFDFIARRGELPERTMFGVFNMGIGFVVIVPPRDAGRVARILERGNSRISQKVFEIGKIEANLNSSLPKVIFSE